MEFAPSYIHYNLVIFLVNVRSSTHSLMSKIEYLKHENRY